MATLAPVAAAGAGWWIDSERVRVATHYRLGQFEQALRSLDRLSQVVRPQPAALFFAAMAQHQLGKRDAAREKLAEVTAAMKLTSERSKAPKSMLDLDRRGWTEKVSERLLRKEAEELILGITSSDHPVSVPQSQ
jgi:hypothetical protein